MDVTVVVNGIPNYVTIDKIAQCFDALFDTGDIGAFYLCDFRNAKYKWHKWQIALHFNSSYDAMIAQSLLDGNNFFIDATIYLLHARLKSDPNMLNNRLFNMVEVKMLRRSNYSYENNSNLSLARQSFQQHSNKLSNYYYFFHSDIHIQNSTHSYSQGYGKYRCSNPRATAYKLPIFPYNRQLKSSKYASIQNKNSSKLHTKNINVSNDEVIVPLISAKNTANTGYEICEVSEVLTLIEDNADQKSDPLKSVESSLHLHPSSDEIDNSTFLDIEDKIWEAIDEVLQDIRKDTFSESDVSEKNM